MSNSDKVFAGSIPRIYEHYLVPLIFAPYAADLARRVSTRNASRILEVAAGTGVVTRALAEALDDRVSIVATDLNQAMLDEAALVPIAHPVQWQQADALALPFGDGEFDVVVCQFGAMFFPDKAKAFSEARRVLKTGGTFFFTVWDRIAENEFADVITSALSSVFPEDPPRFLVRTPHGYHDARTIECDVIDGGFQRPRITTVTARSRAENSRIPALAYCQGTPLRNEIEARGAGRLGEAIDAAANAMSQRFGKGAVEGKIQAHVVTVER
jgi:SAM-dependent methyltransferase